MDPQKRGGLISAIEATANCLIGPIDGHRKGSPVATLQDDSVLGGEFPCFQNFELLTPKGVEGMSDRDPSQILFVLQCI